MISRIHHCGRLCAIDERCPDCLSEGEYIPVLVVDDIPQPPPGDWVIADIAEENEQE